MEVKNPTIAVELSAINNDFTSRINVKYTRPDLRDSRANLGVIDNDVL
jgi:hypothetical protein